MRKWFVTVIAICFLGGILIWCTACRKQELPPFDAAVTSYQNEQENIRVDAVVSIPDAAKEGVVFCASGEPLKLKEKVSDLTNEFFADGISPQLFLNERDSRFFSLEWTGKEDWEAMGYNDSCGFVFNSQSYDYYQNCIVTEPFAEEFNADQYTKLKNLDFMDQDQAAEEVREIFGRYGIVLGDLVKVYVMDHKTMQKNEDLTDINGNYNEDLRKPDWSSADDTYYLYFYQTYRGFPVIYNPYSGEGFEDGEEATVMVNESGVVGANIMGCYEWELLDEVTLIPLDIAVDTFFRNYQGIAETNYQVDKISLMMDIIPGPDYTAVMKPVWVFYTKISGSGYSYTGRIIIDAENGEELTQ